MRRESCRVCDGTGWLVLRKSGFLADGLRRERCHRCQGTGQQRKGQSWPDWEREQAKLREAVQRQPSLLRR